MICEQKLPNGAWCGEGEAGLLLCASMRKDDEMAKTTHTFRFLSLIDDDCMSGFCRMAGCVSFKDNCIAYVSFQFDAHISHTFIILLLIKGGGSRASVRRFVLW